MHWHARFSIAALSIIFLSFEFRQWQSRADRVLTQAFNMNFHCFGALEVRLTLTVFWLLTWTSNFHCFGALEVRQVRLALGQDSATCAGLAHGRDDSYCTRASEQKWQKVLGHCFSLNCRKYVKNSGPLPHAELLKCFQTSLARLLCISFVYAQTLVTMP